MSEKFWVTMTDRFMSGWGQAKGKRNKLVIECDNLEEANIVADNARSRSEMRNVNICKRCPSYPRSTTFTSYHNKEDYKSWFVPGFFSGVKSE